MHLELGLGLGLLEDRLELGGLHDVTLDLELARHEELLGVGLALGEVGEVIVGEDEGDGGLVAEALGDLTGVLEVEVPRSGLASLVLDGEGEDGTALLDGVLALVLRAVEDSVDGIESRGGGELVYTTKMVSRPFCTIWLPCACWATGGCARRGSPHDAFDQRASSSSSFPEGSEEITSRDLPEATDIVMDWVCGGGLKKEE